MFKGQYETHADMLNSFARIVLEIIRAIRKIKDAMGIGGTTEPEEDEEI